MKAHRRFDTIRDTLQAHRPSFLRYFTRALFFLPVFLITSAILYHTTSTILINKSTRASSQIVLSGLDQFENDLQRCDALAETLAKQPDVTALAAESNGYALARIQNLLRSLTVSLPDDMESCGMFFDDTLAIMTDRFYRNQLDLFARMLGLSGGEFETWRGMVRDQSGRTLFCVDSARSGRTLTYVARVPVHGGPWDHVAVFACFRADKIARMLMPDNGVLSDTLGLYGYDGALLFATGDQEKGVFTDVASRAGLTVRIGINTRATDDDLLRFRYIMFWCIVAFIVFCLFYALYLSIQFLHPMIRLSRAAELLDRETPAVYRPAPKRGALPAWMNEEYRYVLAVLSDNGLARQTYEAELKKQEAQMKRLGFLSLLRADFALSPREARLVEAECFLMLVRPAGAEQGERTAQIMSQLTPLIGPDSLCVPVWGDLAVLLEAAAFPQPEDRLALQRRVQEMPGDLSACRVALSAPFREDAAIHETYLHLLDMLLMSDFGGAEAGGQSAEQSADELETLSSVNFDYVYQQLQRGRKDWQSLDACRRLAQTGGREYAIRYVFEVCACVMRYLNAKYPSLERPLDIVEYSRHTALTVQLERLQAALSDGCDILQEHFKRREQARQSGLMQFIDENLSSPSFYSRVVTDRFNISESTLNHMLCEATGMSFFAYVEKKRLEKARRLILETDKLFGEIAELCGYGSAGTFSRAFKRFYNMTPSQMRTMGARSDRA